MAKLATEGLGALEGASNLRISWEALLKDARKCTRCDLYRHATQTVFGEGPLEASIMFVGEQPGDQEDLAGRPFVGPPARCSTPRWRKRGSIVRPSTSPTPSSTSNSCSAASAASTTSPTLARSSACRWWIEHERELIRPPLTVALGATAARSLVGKVVTISKVRGEPLMLADGSECWITVHPSSILRAPSEEARRDGKRLFLRDLKLIKARAEELAR